MWISTPHVSVTLGKQYCAWILMSRKSLSSGPHATNSKKSRKLQRKFFAFASVFTRCEWALIEANLITSIVHTCNFTSNWVKTESSIFHAKRFLLLLHRFNFEVLICSPKAGRNRKICDGQPRGMAEVTLDGKQCLVMAWE